MDFRDNYLIKLEPFHASLPSVRRNRRIFLFPNPRHACRDAESRQGVAGETYTVYDQTGREVLAGKLMAETTQVDVSSLPNGVYVLRLMGKHGLRFVKN